MKLLVMGPPGAGKGTLADGLEEVFPIKHISTGDIFRDNIKNNTELGKLATSFIEKGALVPDEVTNNMVEELLKNKLRTESFILDGYPRNLSQAEAFDSNCEVLGISIDAVLNIEVDDSEIVKRLSGRRVCKSCTATYHIIDNKPQVEGVCDKCGSELVQRNDDKQDTILYRLSVYHQATETLLQHYRKTAKVLTIANVVGIDKAREVAISLLKENKIV